MTKKKEPTDKVCSKCLVSKNIKREFYLAANDIINADGRLCICKQCLKDNSKYSDTEQFISLLRMIDRPFVKSHYESSKVHDDPAGEYFRRIAMRQHRGETYLDSQFDGSFESHVAKPASEINKVNKVKDEISFKVTPEMVVKWGENFSDSQLYQLESFFVAMNEANDIKTPQHVESLKLLCKLNVLQNKALEEGQVNDFKNLNTQFNKLMETSGLRPIDRKTGGESAGIRTFGQIWEEIEKDGFIEPYPYQEKQDIVDKTILYIGNYTRKLMNMQSMSSPPDDTPIANESDSDES